MRVVLVGRPADRDRLRAQLRDTGILIAGEATTLSAARAGNWQADAFLFASPDSGADDRLGVDEPLTPRELEVLALLAEGLPNKAIALQLGISDQTVKFHVAAVIGKLGATNRTDAVRRAVGRGLVVL